MEYSINQINYFLRRWKMLEINRNNLSQSQIRKAKILFNSLKKINETDLKILKEKFYDSEKYTSFDAEHCIYKTVIPLNDETMAAKYSMNIYHYRKIKGIALRNLQKAFKDTEQEIAQKDLIVRLKINSFLYVRNVEIKPYNPIFMSSIDKIMVGTEREARIFDTRNELEEFAVTKLERLGFIRESVLENCLQEDFL